MTDMTQEERILAALRGDPKTAAELAEVLGLNAAVLCAVWVGPMIKAGLVVALPDRRLADGQLALPEEASEVDHD